MGSQELRRYGPDGTRDAAPTPQVTSLTLPASDNGQGRNSETVEKSLRFNFRIFAHL
jgi:hypothetical protein